MVGNVGGVRRKSEAAANADNDSTPHRHEGGKKNMGILKEGPVGGSPNAENG